MPLVTPMPTYLPAYCRIGHKLCCMSAWYCRSRRLRYPSISARAHQCLAIRQWCWPLMRLVLVAGPPVIAILATAPLLQSWFAQLDPDEAASDPYFLYAGSNAGSLLALLAYPLL